MPIVFVVFHEYPEVMGSLSESIESATKQIDSHESQGCFAMTLCGASFLSQFNKILGIVDELIGRFDVNKVAEFVLEIIEVFCKYFNIDLRDSEQLQALANSVQDIIQVASGTLKKLFGDILPSSERDKKWGKMGITKKIKEKLSEFDTGSPIVERTITSFERFFGTVEQIDDKYQDTKSKKVRSNPIDIEITNNNEGWLSFVLKFFLLKLNDFI